MCRAALQSPRKSIIFEPYPSIVDPLNPKTLAFSPKVSPRLISSAAQAPRDLLFSPWNVDVVWQVQNYERLQKTLHNILLIKTTGQVPFCIIYSQINGSFGNLRACQTVLDGWRWLFFSWNIQGPPCEIKKQMDKRDPLAHPLLMWWVALPALQNCVHPPLFLKLKRCVCNRILSSNKSHIVKLSQNQVLLNQMLLAQKSHIKYY